MKTNQPSRQEGVDIFKYNFNLFASLDVDQSISQRKNDSSERGETEIATLFDPNGDKKKLKPWNKWGKPKIYFDLLLSAEIIKPFNAFFVVLHRFMFLPILVFTYYFTECNYTHFENPSVVIVLYYILMSAKKNKKINKFRCLATTSSQILKVKHFECWTFLLTRLLSKRNE